jgi:hypothetical protein
VDAVWLRGHWWCASEERGCDFFSKQQPPRRWPLPRLTAALPDDDPCQPHVLRDADVEVDLVIRTAALLQHSAYGPMTAWLFVAPSDAGLGLFARSRLRSGQALGEYGGPRLPLGMLRKGSYVLEMPSADEFIDGACENSPFDDGKRYPVVFANHSRRPNARLEEWPCTSGDQFDVEHRIWLVASEPIEAGHEIRIDYENGGQKGQCWKGVPNPSTSTSEPGPHHPAASTFLVWQVLEGRAAGRGAVAARAARASAAQPGAARCGASSRALRPGCRACGVVHRQ